MDKVYLVTSGCYSDYHVDYVFTSKAKAEAFIEKGNDSDDGDIYQIEEMDITESVPKVYKYWEYSVAGRSKNCKIKIIEHTTTQEKDEYSNYRGTRYSAGWGYTPVSAERAQKLATEMYQRYIREAADPTSERYEAINDNTPIRMVCTGF